MTAQHPHDEPSDVVAEQGEVLVEGPDGVSVSLTPAAALETSDRLLKAGTQAHGQRMLEDGKDRPR